MGVEHFDGVVVSPEPSIILKNCFHPLAFLYDSAELFGTCIVQLNLSTPLKIVEASLSASLHKGGVGLFE